MQGRGSPCTLPRSRCKAITERYQCRVDFLLQGGIDERRWCCSEWVRATRCEAAQTSEKSEKSACGTFITKWINAKCQMLNSKCRFFWSLYMLMIVRGILCIFMFMLMLMLVLSDPLFHLLVSDEHHGGCRDCLEQCDSNT